VADGHHPEPSTSGASYGTPARFSLLVWALGAALVAGFVSWRIGEAMHGYYRPPKAASGGRYDFSALNREQAVADRKNAVIAFGTFGALLASTFGVAGALGRRSWIALATAMLAGLVLGGLGGALVSYGVAPMFSRFYADKDPVLLLPVLVRGSICAVIGMAAGLALGLGARGPAGALRPLTGGLLGSLFGVIASETINAVVYPMDRNDQLIPTSMIARLLCYVGVAGCVALGAVIVGQSAQVIGETESIAP